MAPSEPWYSKRRCTDCCYNKPEHSRANPDGTAQHFGKPNPSFHHRISPAVELETRNSQAAAPQPRFAALGQCCRKATVPGMYVCTYNTSLAKKHHDVSNLWPPHPIDLDILHIPDEMSSRYPPRKYLPGVKIYLSLLLCDVKVL